jgi:hypothetical protein
MPMRIRWRGNYSKLEAHIRHPRARFSVPEEGYDAERVLLIPMLLTLWL